MTPDKGKSILPDRINNNKTVIRNNFAIVQINFKMKARKLLLILQSIYF